MSTSASADGGPSAFPRSTFLHSSYRPPYPSPPSPSPSFYDLSSWPADPLHVFTAWMADAEAAYHALPRSSSAPVTWPNTMQLATCTDGQPHVRNVLLKGLDARGLVFYTNYDGGKGQQLKANPRVAVSFYWKGLERQVRMEGAMERVSDEESDDYFHCRPLGSQVSAASSCQSQPISSRAELEAHYIAQVTRVAEALQRAKAQGTESPSPTPLSVPSVPSSTAFRRSVDGEVVAVRAHHHSALQLLEELQADASNAPLLRRLVQRPHNWGGFLLRPQAVEFWEDGQYRLHSRVEYRREHRREDTPATAAGDGSTADWRWSLRFLSP